MHRDPSIFPNDEDGDILWNMHLADDDLIGQRSVNFSVLFEAEANADAYAAEMREAAFEVQVDDCLDTYDIPAWEAVTTAHIILSYERITALTDLISSIAASHGGVPNGWATELRPNYSGVRTPIEGEAIMKNGLRQSTLVKWFIRDGQYKLYGIALLVSIFWAASIVGEHRNAKWRALEHLPRLTDEQIELCQVGKFDPDHCALELRRRKIQAARDDYGSRPDPRQ